jgi:hypothetical protein
MPIVFIFGAATATALASAWTGLDGGAAAQCVAESVHTGFYGSAQVKAETNAPEIDIIFQIYPAAASAKVATSTPAIAVDFALTPSPANCVVGIKRGANCGGPYGCLTTEAGNPVLDLPIFLQAYAAPTCSTTASLGVSALLYSDRPPSCRVQVATNATVGIIQGLTGEAQASLYTFDVPTRSGDISGLIVQEIRLEAIPVAVKCNTHVCISDFVVTGPISGDWLTVDQPLGVFDTGIDPWNPFGNTLG